MLPITAIDVRLFLHVLAATVWVGGQIVLVALVPTLRGTGADVPRVAARRFALVAWPAFGVLIATGIWNLLEISLGDTSGRYQTTLAIKLGVVALSGVAAFVHQQARRPVMLAVWGALSLLSALAALFLGVVLHG